MTEKDKNGKRDKEDMIKKVDNKWGKAMLDT